VCRTAALGGQIEQCDQCGHQRICYRSCRNRHCPKCQSLARAEWIQRRQAELLDCEYFHVVFTVPEEIAAIAYQNKEVVYSILFRATAETLRTIAADPKHLGAEIGFFAVLHTWGSNLMHHPHLHCVVPGGGLSPDDTRWISCKPGFFLPVRVLSRLFRRLFLEYLQTAFDAGKIQFFTALANLENRREFVRYLAPLRKAEWVVYAKAPFSGPQQVLDYVGRYTHRVAISNHRLLDIDAGQVCFQWKDYRDKGQQKAMRLSAEEFIRRFLLHTLPDGFQRIRYYGLLGNRYRRQKLARCRQLLGMAPPPEMPVPQDYRDQHELLTGSSLRECPLCHRGRMLMIEMLTPHRIASNPEHLMSSIVAFARSLLSLDWFHQPCGKALPAGAADPSFAIDFLTHQAFDPLDSSLTFGKVGRSSPAVEFFSLVHHSATHSIPIGAAFVERFSPIHF
jgi:Putative transposase/Transposase zinc-binding domain